MQKERFALSKRAKERAIRSFCLKKERFVQKTIERIPNPSLKKWNSMIWHGMAYIAVSGCFGKFQPWSVWKQVTTNQYKGFEKQGRHFEKWMNFDRRS